MQIAIISSGAGYVGPVAGACLANFGCQGACVDHDAGKIAAIKDAQIPIYEPGPGAADAKTLATSIGYR